MKKNSTSRPKSGLIAAVLIVLGIGLSAVNGHAATIELTTAQIGLAQGGGLDQWAPTTTGTTAGQLHGGSQFIALFDSSFHGIATATWTLDLSSDIAVTSGDVFDLTILNSNSNPWDFQVSVLTDAGTIDSGFVSFGPNFSHDFALTLGAGTTSIDKVYVTVRGGVPLGPDPINNGDWAANFNVYPTPEPSSLLLLGSGLLGITFAGRRFGRSKS